MVVEMDFIYHIDLCDDRNDKRLVSVEYVAPGSWGFRLVVGFYHLELSSTHHRQCGCSRNLFKWYRKLDNGDS